MVTVCQDGFAEFLFFRPEVASVHLAGDFNDWRTDQLKMVRRSDGYWVLRLALPEGSYKFRYVADGLWYTDYAAFGVEPGRFGLDSVIWIPPRALPFPAVAPARAAA